VIEKVQILIYVTKTKAKSTILVVDFSFIFSYTIYTFDIFFDAGKF